jgi:hypothetical protein
MFALFVPLSTPSHPPFLLAPASSFIQTHRVGGDNVVHECRKRHTPASPFHFKISAPSSCRKEPKRPAKSISLNDLYDLHGEILLGTVASISTSTGTKFSTTKFSTAKFNTAVYWVQLYTVVNNSTK